ncbi:neoverrucotoxin subunit beta-like [Acipenser ruthenus]|uniref:neoverrucotoxin subunit beta-like n=1 Tax=Acipenser ruthenus TaxID=7906 RepID=UPI0027428861|nr:neoverrucotoxin subunit beta-like [Acipenser ruthenus]
MLSSDACDLTHDLNTVCSALYLSEGNRKVKFKGVTKPYPDHPKRFARWLQVLCREGLSARCYWEIEWCVGVASLGVAYKGMSRKGSGIDSLLGHNDKSWCLWCFGSSSSSAWHNNNETVIPALRSPRVGVFLDWPAGTLSFYSVSSDAMTLLHTFHTTFTQPLYPGFRLGGYGSSVSIRQLE